MTPYEPPGLSPAKKPAHEARKRYMGCALVFVLIVVMALLLTTLLAVVFHRPKKRAVRTAPAAAGALMETTTGSLQWSDPPTSWPPG